jgi:hypothetical protein
MKRILIITAFTLASLLAGAVDLPFRIMGLCISAPGHDNVKEFCSFIREDLGPMGLNCLILRVDFNYEFDTHPELRDENPLTRKDIKMLVSACKEFNIKLIPQINLLGHQSWASKTDKLLEVYPQFDETPWVSMPEKYEWPNNDELYCKSYCPLHPEIHKILFDIIGELVDVFETDAFHAGMDEVFYIGESKCPRCGGRDKAELFAGEVNLINNFLSTKGCQLWIWGDRLLDGKDSGYGMWEASMNNTHRAIDLIDKDIMICDWHYERADLSSVLFAYKGFNVVTCPYREPEIALKQLENTKMFIETSPVIMKDRFAGILQTDWGSAGEFMTDFREIEKNGSAVKEKEKSAANTLFLLLKNINTTPVSDR